jgi:chromosome segregation protein
LAEAREKYQAREDAARDLRRRREDRQGQLSGQETELVKLDLRLERLAEDLRRDWRVVLPDPEDPDEAGTAAAESGAEPPAPPAVLDCREWAARQLPDEAPARRDALRSKMEALGEVSLGAIEKEAELKAEYERYQEQYEELTRAMADLKTSIGRLNHTCRLLFGDTFKAVDEKFREIFPILFEGGQGWLSLNDESDPLESGVEIHVHPPGKKLLVMSLLSGGEKALTALALIFALYLIKPSPFCLLDETDAPLDEANIDRFNRLLQRLGRASQIIMVTHNKRTMQICRTLYGVTMETPGVSRLVSVNLAEAEVMADA